MLIAKICQAVLELFGFKVEPGSYCRGVSVAHKDSEIFVSLTRISQKITAPLTNYDFLRNQIDLPTKPHKI